MMEKIPCLGCGSMLGIEATGCQICLRPRTRQEIMRGYAKLREAETRRKRLPFKILGALAAAALVGKAGWVYRGNIRAASASVRGALSRFADQATDPRNLVDRPTAPPPPAAPAPAAPAAPAGAPGPLLVVPSAPDPQAVRIGAVPPAPPQKTAPVGDLPLPPFDEDSWAVYGRVYDLRTLKPVPNAPISFRAEGGGIYGYTTDQDGRYVVVLARLSSGGYDAFTYAPDYAAPAQHENDIPYLKLSRDERAGLIDSAQSGDVHATPLTDSAGERSRRVDLFIAPKAARR